MIGYLIFPTKNYRLAKAEAILKKSITFKLFKEFHAENNHIIFFKNRFSNNYFIETDEHFIATVGTFIFNEEIGEKALQKLLDRFDHNNPHEVPYAEFTGSYNLVYFDKIRKKIILWTDREGLQSGYGYFKDNAWAYSSNLIMLAALVRAEIDFKSVQDFIHIGATVNGRTIFKGIKQMDSATIFEEKGENWVSRRLWQINIQESNYNYSDPKIVNELSNKMITYLGFLKKLKETDICTDLSGGTDSRTVLSILLKIKRKVDINVAGPEDHEDVVIHKKIAEKLNLHSLWYADPLKDFNVTRDKLLEAIEIADGTRNAISLMPGLPFFKERAEKYIILLGGNGGPLFKDHYWLFEFNRINRKREPNWDRIAHLSTIDYTWQDDIFRNSEREGDRLAKLYLNHSKRIRGTNNQKLDYVYFDLKMKAYHAPQFTTCNQFFNIYHPFCDGRLVEFSINIRPYIRKRANLQFSLIYKNNKKVAWIPTNDGIPAVPSTGKFFFLKIYVLLRYARALRRKIGMYILHRNALQSVYNMSPIYEQLKSLGYMKKFLTLENMKTASLYKENEIERMLRDPNKSSNIDYLLNILSVEMCISYKEYLEDKKPDPI